MPDAVNPGPGTSGANAVKPPTSSKNIVLIVLAILGVLLLFLIACPVFLIGAIGLFGDKIKHNFTTSQGRLKEVQSRMNAREGPQPADGGDVKSDPGANGAGTAPGGTDPRRPSAAPAPGGDTGTGTAPTGPGGAQPKPPDHR